MCSLHFHSLQDSNDPSTAFSLRITKGRLGGMITVNVNGEMVSTTPFGIKILKHMRKPSGIEQ